MPILRAVPLLIPLFLAYSLRIYLHTLVQASAQLSKRSVQRRFMLHIGIRAAQDPIHHLGVMAERFESMVLLLRDSLLIKQSRL